MEYRQLGQTGYSVSRLGFGAMRLPMTGKGEDAQVNRELAIPLIHRAFEAGINYIDTARGYCNTDSQRAVGEAVENWHDRESIIISTNNPYFGKDEKKWWKNLEDSLRRLRVESIGEEEWEPGQKADKCIECGECEIKCPQNIPIINQLAEAHQMLSGKNVKCEKKNPVIQLALILFTLQEKCIILPSRKEGTPYGSNGSRIAQGSTDHRLYQFGSD